MLKFTQFLQLYTLHQIEHSPYGRREVLHVRLAVLRYGLRQLPGGLNQQWQSDPHRSINQARDVIVPRLARILEDNTVQQQLLQPQDWQPYHARREAHAVPTLPASTPTPQTPSGFDKRLHQAEQVLRFTKTALEVANAGLVLWKSWRALRDDNRLVIDALNRTIQGQEQALQRGTDTDFVRGYLAAHQDDPAHRTIFMEDDTDG